MKVYALVGKSGTGKSYQALYLSKDKGIEYLIDDGLFITKNKILAGKSAKRENNKIKAVKTALFNEEEHMSSVCEAIKKANPDKILVIGTSDNMVNKIVARLGLGGIDEYIRIDDITTDEEREIARQQRQELGKHVIPVPSFQLKHTFSGYFIDPLKILRSVGIGKHEVAEKSEIRPAFSYLGKYEIADSALNDIIQIVSQKDENVSEVTKALIDSDHQGVTLNISVIGVYGQNVFETLQLFQRKLADEFERITGMHIKNINIQIKGIESEPA